MLHYCVDNEIMTALYKAYRPLKEQSIEGLHELGKQYAALLSQYELKEETIDVIRRLCTFSDDEEWRSLENKIIHGYLMAKKDLKKEKEEFAAFIDLFDKDEKQALQGLADHVLNQQIIPYRIKNRSLHIDVLSTPAMSLQLDFSDVLIEDGRHPREIMMSHISGEKFYLQEKIKKEDGTIEMIEMPWYRIRFINSLQNSGPYATKESSFVFKSVRGALELYDYSSLSTPLDVNDDKVPWRLLMHPLKAVLEKAQILGIDYLDEKEMQALPVICVFYELIQFYLNPQTTPGIGRSLISYEREQAEGFAFSQNDLNAVCEYFEPFGLETLTEWLRKANEDRDAFVRFWIQYASIKKSEKLFDLLIQILKDCSCYYSQKPRIMTQRKYHMMIRNALNEFFNDKKWRGDFPYYRKLEASKFLEVSNVYSKMYTYVNEKKKGFYIDFIESEINQSYVITAITGYILLTDQDQAKEYTATRGYFLDGGRRNSRITGQIEIHPMMPKEEVMQLLNKMVKDVMKSFY